MFKKDIAKLLLAILKNFRKYIENEKEHPVGKINLGFALLLTIAFIAGCIPNIVVLAVRILLNRTISGWEWSIPLIAFVFMAAFFYACLRLIPPKRISSGRASKINQNQTERSKRERGRQAENWLR